MVKVHKKSIKGLKHSWSFVKRSKMSNMKKTVKRVIFLDIKKYLGRKLSEGYIWRSRLTCKAQLPILPDLEGAVLNKFVFLKNSEHWGHVSHLFQLISQEEEDRSSADGMAFALRPLWVKQSSVGTCLLVWSSLRSGKWLVSFYSLSSLWLLVRQKGMVANSFWLWPSLKVLIKKGRMG